MEPERMTLASSWTFDPDHADALLLDALLDAAEEVRLARTVGRDQRDHGGVEDAVGQHGLEEFRSIGSELAEPLDAEIRTCFEINHGVLVGFVRPFGIAPRTASVVQLEG